MTKGSLIAQCAIKHALRTNNPYIKNSLNSIGAISAVNRIFTYGRNENGEKLQVTKWFKQQVRLIADNRLRHVLTTGASQISKSLGNYLVAIDDLINGHINIGWVYASRQSMINQQPSQFQAMVKHWISHQGTYTKPDRDSISRYRIGNATANFSYANSASEAVQGGSAEGKEQNSFQASKLYFEERSSWKKNIDMSPRLGASKIKSKPIRELGTPGSGTGIERSIADAAHNFEPGLICPYCNQLSWIHPLGNLLKPKVTLQNGFEYFNTRGEIIDFYGTDASPYVACSNCKKDITNYIEKCQLYSLQSQESADKFLDNLPDGEVYYPSVSIYLSPLLKVPEDEYRLLDLVREGLNPESALIYHQNKLGIESRFTITGVTAFDYERVLKAKPWVIPRPLKFAGIDQGTDTHYLVEFEYDPKTENTNITAVSPINETQIVRYLRDKKIDLAVIDNEPGRMSANTLATESRGVLVLADQRDILNDFKAVKVEYGGVEIDCFAISNTLYKEEVISGFVNKLYRIDCTPHRKFQKHITSIKRDLATGQFQRPPDKDDDFFFALMFAACAKSIYLQTHKKSASSSVGKPLNKLKKI